MIPEMGDQPKVGIVLLNWNSYEDTARCLSSIQESEYDNKFVIVIDNGSSDKSGDRLKNDFPECTVKFNEENRGFAAGCNSGIKYCLEQEADYVLLLNNDIKVSSDFLKPLVETAENNENVAGVGGVIYYEGTREIWDAGGEMQPFFANHSKYTEIQSSSEYQSEFVTCAMNLLSKEFLPEYQLDEEFFFGVEEIDLSWRAKTNGWNLFINPKSKVHHDVGSATNHMFAGEALFSPFQKYHNTRGRLYHSSKNLQWYHTLFFYLASLFIYPVIYLLMGARYGRFDILYAHLLSLFDYFITSDVKKPGYFE